MPTMQITFETADPSCEDALRLLREMRAEALTRYAGVLDPSGPSPTNDPPVARSVFLIARLAGEAVACAALRPVDSEVGEVRRMYVRQAVRRCGIGRRLLAELERVASVFGYRVLRLETGNRQPEAMALYTAYGFQRIAPYGRHIADPLSICFEKRVENNAGPLLQ